MTSAIDGLIELVDKDICPSDYVINHTPLVGRNLWITSAFYGDLNAAMALHNAILPDWHWKADDGQGQEMPFWYVFSADDKEADGEAENPARAWLLAILKGYKVIDDE